MALENPEMGGVIEVYLMKKLDEAIKDPAFTEQNLRAKIQDLKDLLLKKGSSEQEKRREKLYQLNNVLTEWQMKSKKKGSYIPKALHSCQLSKILKQIKADVEKKIKSGVLEGGSTQPSNEEASLPKEPESYRCSSQHVDPEKVHGLEDKAMTLERILVRGERNDHFKAIGIVGIAGIGKTTLCQFLLTRQEVKDHFFPRIWVCMSKQPREDSDNRKEIVRRMLTAIGVEEEIIDSADNNHGLAGLVSALRLQLMGKRYLIILDDAWNSDEFYQQLNSRSTQARNVVEHLAYSLPKGYDGAVIVTSRSEELAKKMVGEENLHRLPPTDRESCWMIFKDSVQEDGKQFPQYLEELKNEIVSKCFGLPLAAKVMGQIVNENSKKNSSDGDGDQQKQVEKTG